MSRANEPAAPAHGIYVDSDGRFEVTVAHRGLTIRERFAMAAMEGLCANAIPGSQHIPERRAQEAVAQADALIAELDCTSADKFTTLALAVQALLPAIDSEIDQRKTGGNDEDWLNLQHLVDNVREALP